MTVTVLSFASLSDLLGASQTLELSGPSTVAELLDQLESSHPELKRYQRRYRVAVNQEFVELDAAIPEGAEVALIPPVSGGAPPTLKVRICEQSLSTEDALEAVRRKDCGAVVLFLGTVRDITGDQVTERLDYTVYQALAEKELTKICQEAIERWPLGGVTVEHRVGSLSPGDVAVVVAASSPHRQGAFEAARFLIDTTKERVPLWKKEIGPDGQAWIEGDARVDARGVPATNIAADHP